MSEWPSPLLLPQAIYIPDFHINNKDCLHYGIANVCTMLGVNGDGGNGNAE